MAAKSIIEAHEAGLTWVMDDWMQRASHALVDGEDVWLIDPVDEKEAIERAMALSRPRAVIQLLECCLSATEHRSRPTRQRA
jgi:hypothetical protein